MTDTMTGTVAPPTREAFAGALGDVLAGRLESPGRTPLAYAIFAHCFTCGKDAVAVTRIARALTAHGIAVLRFDFTGIGQSAGAFARTTFSSNVEDLVRAADHLRDRYRAPTLLLGHSLGGAAVLAAAARIPEVRAIATIGAPADPRHVLHLLAGSRDDLEATGTARVDLGGRPIEVGIGFVRDLEDRDGHLEIAGDAALLVMHSPVDRIVPIEHARAIFDAARHPKSFVALDGADHLLSRRSDAEFAAGVIGAWAGRYAVDPDALAHDPELAAVRPATPPEPDPEPGIVVVGENERRPFGQDVAVGRHRLTADEPEPVGSDSGPAPYDFLLSALGACTSMTLRMYADRKQWPVGRIEVSLRRSKIPAASCTDCHASTGQVDRIHRTITIAGPLTDEQREGLTRIADRCPVHRSLHGAISVVTTLRATLDDDEADAEQAQVA